MPAEGTWRVATSRPSGGAGRDWVAWHAGYEDPGSGLSSRLEVIRRRIRERLDRADPGPIRAISLCAGQGLDLIGALAGHPRRDDVTARLVELDPVNAEAARRSAAGAGLTRLEVVTGDGSHTSAYEGAVPAQLILACGIFGNITDADVRNTISVLPRLSAPGATVVWTRHRRAPDLTVAIRRWLSEAGYEEVAFEPHPTLSPAVGVHRLTREPEPFQTGMRMFSFVGYDQLGP